MLRGMRRRTRVVAPCALLDRYGPGGYSICRMNGAARTRILHVEAAQIEGTPTTAFGKYQLFASLGRGGMADVFLSVARGQMGFNKLAVIKRLRQALAEEPAFRNMFLDEARLAARLGHPNIVHTYEVAAPHGVYF